MLQHSRKWNSFGATKSVIKANTSRESEVVWQCCVGTATIKKAINWKVFWVFSGFFYLILNASNRTDTNLVQSQ